MRCQHNGERSERIGTSPMPKLRCMPLPGSPSLTYPTHLHSDISMPAAAICKRAREVGEPNELRMGQHRWPSLAELRCTVGHCEHCMRKQAARQFARKHLTSGRFSVTPQTTGCVRGRRPLVRKCIGFCSAMSGGSRSSGQVWASAQAQRLGKARAGPITAPHVRKRDVSLERPMRTSQ